VAMVQSAYATPSLVDSMTELLEKENQGGPDLTGGGGGSGSGTYQGTEGLSPGYWKQSQHFSDWAAPYTTTSLFNTVFGIPQEPGLTLLAALERNGGGTQAVARQAVAALLNAAHPRIDYSFTEGQVIAMVRLAYEDSSLVDATKTRLEVENT